MAGNFRVVRNLIDGHGVNVNARVRVDIHAIGAEKGMGALALAATCCPQRSVSDIVAALLAAGADPNSAGDTSGVTPLIAAVAFKSLGGVLSLLTSEKIDLEKALPFNRATALNVAGYMSTFEIVKALIDAGADYLHV